MKMGCFPTTKLSTFTRKFVLCGTRASIRILVKKTPALGQYTSDPHGGTLPQPRRISLFPPPLNNLPRWPLIYYNLNFFWYIAMIYFEFTSKYVLLNSHLPNVKFILCSLIDWIPRSNGSNLFVENYLSSLSSPVFLCAVHKRFVVVLQGETGLKFCPVIYGLEVWA